MEDGLLKFYFVISILEFPREIFASKKLTLKYESN